MKFGRQDPNLWGRLREAPFWNVLALYGHWPALDLPPLWNRQMWKKSAANHPGKEWPYGNKTFQKEASLAALIHNILQISYFCLWFFQEPGNLVHAMINLFVFACSYFLCFTCFVFCIFLTSVNQQHGLFQAARGQVGAWPNKLVRNYWRALLSFTTRGKVANGKITFLFDRWFILSLVAQNVTLENTQCTLIYLTWSDSNDR